MLEKIKLFFLVLLALLPGAYSSTFLHSEPESLKSEANSPALGYTTTPLRNRARIYTKKVKICLTMIVKNESNVIERCLNSVKDIVDCISICDTGSTDNTVEIIEEFMKNNHIPGKVHEHVWKNFGHNRSLSAQAAKATLEDLDFPLSSTYLLLLDADMVLHITPLFNKYTFTADAYSLRQSSGLISYYNTRLIRASLPWESIGVTHEFWSCRQPHSYMQLGTLTIDDREDGGCKTDKLERDLKYLIEGIKNEPNNSRYMFYLAQTYTGLKNFNEAIHWYQACIQAEGWREEVWFSKFMIGEIYEELGFWGNALHWYLDAYSFNSKRAEPLQKIASYYRLNHQNHLAYLFAKQGSLIPYPEEDLLFVFNATYQYKFDEEISIAAYYTPFKEEGLAATNRLLLKKGLPQDSKNQARLNVLFYVQNLKDAQFDPLKIELPLIREEMLEHYNPMNCSIIKTLHGYRLLCRTVNYDRSLHFKSRDPLDPTIRSRNFLIDYDAHFNILSQKEIIEDFPRQYDQSRIRGLEDCRLFSLNHHLWFTCATFGTHPCIGQTLCQLADDSSDSIIKVENLIPLKMPNPSRHEKNWLPFIKDQELYAIYLYDPLTIYKIDTQTGNYETVHQSIPSYDFSNFRGSTAPIEFDDGYLMLVHEVLLGKEDHYLHRFLFLDKEWNIKKLSKPFFFKHKGVEYCTGMTIDHSGNQCIMPISIEDKEAWLCTLPLKTIHSLLEPLP